MPKPLMTAAASSAARSGRGFGLTRRARLDVVFGGSGMPRLAEPFPIARSSLTASSYRWRRSSVAMLACTARRYTAMSAHMRTSTSGVRGRGSV